MNYRPVTMLKTIIEQRGNRPFECDVHIVETIGIKIVPKLKKKPHNLVYGSFAIHDVRHKSVQKNKNREIDLVWLENDLKSK